MTAIGPRTSFFVFSCQWHHELRNHSHAFEGHLIVFLEFGGTGVFKGDEPVNKYHQYNVFTVIE